MSSPATVGPWFDRREFWKRPLEGLRPKNIHMTIMTTWSWNSNHSLVKSTCFFVGRKSHIWWFAMPIAVACRTDLYRSFSTKPALGKHRFIDATWLLGKGGVKLEISQLGPFPHLSPPMYSAPQQRRLRLMKKGGENRWSRLDMISFIPNVSSGFSQVVPSGKLT